MAIINSQRDVRIRNQNGIDSNLNRQQFHDLVDERRGSTSVVNNLEKNYVLSAVPVIIDATTKRKF